MLKKLILLGILLMLGSDVFAAAYLVSPAEKTISDGGIAEIGSIAPGETAELFFKKKSGEGFDWESIAVDDATLPDGWVFLPGSNADAISARLLVPADAPESTQLIGFEMRSPQGSLPFTAKFFVRRSLLTISIKDLNRRAVVGEKLSYGLVAVNESIASHKVSVFSTLPSYWLKSQKLELGPKQSRELSLEVLPRTYGERNFRFIVKSGLNGSQKEFQSNLSVSSTLQSKFSAPLFGFPFFSPTMISPYLLNSVLSLLS